jgi:SAM-dependent methyltransferase
VATRSAAEAATLAAIVARASRAYAPAGRTPMHFARGKLRHDPVFAAIVARGLVNENARLVDLGCGQGVLAAFLCAAREEYAARAWPEGWAPAPRLASVVGFDLRRSAIRAGRIALGDAARLEVADVRAATLPECDRVAILDVLHYLPAPDQEAVLDRCRAVLSPGGLLLLRVGDASPGWRFAVTRLSDQLVTLMRGSMPRLHFRTLSDWRALLARVGFEVESTPMSDGTPFANVLLVGRR